MAGAQAALRLLPNHLFLTGDARIANSFNSYFSDPTGRISNYANEWLGEGRLVFGTYFIFKSQSGDRVIFDVSPYFGVGLRDLYSDATHVPGRYRRNSEYFTRRSAWPSASPSMTVRGSASMKNMTPFFWDASRPTNDATLTYPNTVNNQNGGFGIRGSVMYEWKSWALGPFVDYWIINHSETSVFLLAIPACSLLCTTMRTA